MKFKFINNDCQHNKENVLDNTNIPVSVALREISNNGVKNFSEKFGVPLDQVEGFINEVSQNIHRWVRFDLTELPNTILYFVTVISTDVSALNANVESTRVWGFYPVKSMAEEVILNNISDIYECLYQWAVIEEIPWGVPALSNTKRESWYHWNDVYKKYHECAKPDFAKQFFNWGLP